MRRHRPFAGRWSNRGSRPRATLPSRHRKCPLCRLSVLPQRHRRFVTAEAVTAVAGDTTPSASKLQLVSMGSVRRRSVPASQHRGAMESEPPQPWQPLGAPRCDWGDNRRGGLKAETHVPQRASANHFDTDVPLLSINRRCIGVTIGSI